MTGALSDRPRTPSLAIWFAGAALLCAVLFVDVPPWPRIFVVISNAAHGPVFGAIALLAWNLVRTRARSRPLPWIGAIFVGTVLAGATVEWVQGLIGRDSSWSDIGTDALGAASVLGWLTYRQATQTRAVRNAGLWVAVLAAVLMIAPLAHAAGAYGLRALRMPTLAAFTLPWDLYFMKPQSATTRRSPLPPQWARAGDPTSLAVRFEQGEWPGLAFDEPSPDWRGHRSLKLDLTNPGSTPLELTLRVHDVEHDQRHEDRFNRRLTVAPQARTVVTVSLTDIESAPQGRRLDLGRVAGMVLFATGESALPGRQFFLTRIWLE